MLCVIHCRKRLITERKLCFNGTKQSVFTYYFQFLPRTLADPDIPEIDLAFALSVTAIDSVNNFRQMKSIINYIITRYGQDKIRYSVIIFGGAARIHVRFQDMFSDDDRLAAYISALPKVDGGPRLDGALVEARKLFLDGGGSRPDAQKVDISF